MTCGPSRGIRYRWIPGSGSASCATSTAPSSIRRYRPLRWYSVRRLNNRTHRKLLVIDGRIGFTGGVGIADLWQGNAEDPDHWRETHFRIEGPVVAQFQAAFNDNWIKMSGTVLHGEAYFPKAGAAGDGKGQIFMSSSEGGSESVAERFFTG